MFSHPKSFTFIGFHLNSLVDQGESLSIESMKKLLSSKNLLRSLQNKYKLNFDMSIFSDSDILKIEAFFEGCYDSIDESRKFGVENNALCLLIAYCFEAAQRNEKDVIFD